MVMRDDVQVVDFVGASAPSYIHEPLSLAKLAWMVWNCRDVARIFQTTDADVNAFVMHDRDRSIARLHWNVMEALATWRPKMESTHSSSTSAANANCAATTFIRPMKGWFSPICRRCSALIRRTTVSVKYAVLVTS